MEKKIYLRAMEPEDLDFIYEVENDERIWQAGSTNVPYSRQALIDYITSATCDIYADRQVRLIVEDESRQPVGIVDLMNFDPRHLRAELGVVIHPSHQGRGLAKLAVAHVLRYAAGVLHLHQVYAIVAATNLPSVRMLQSLGFQGGNVLRDWLTSERGYEDAYFFQTFL